jgi:hypothetical protein
VTAVYLTGLVALFVFSLCRAAQRAEEVYLPTARQRRQWRRERLAFKRRPS